MSGRADLVELLVQRGVLRFGDFTLKSGRKSRYFFNLGNLDDGESLARIGSELGQLLLSEVGADGFDLVFGPAYKGITLAAATVDALWREHGLSKPFCYDRKEEKTHGEGGRFVGRTPAAGTRVVVVDDVITDGATKVDAVRRIEETGAQVVAVAIVLDRQDPHPDGGVQSERFVKETGKRLLSLLSKADVEPYLEDGSSPIRSSQS
ncbi:MAG: orotate phosphoribosyltransferase [Planctomycetota bacterium]|nr:orotate phosphoribosyltransferase [Planctomycetota bacterium]